MSNMTPAQAAQTAKIGRTTIMRALERAELKGLRDNSGRWQITPEALEDWLSMRGDRSHVRSDDRQSPPLTAPDTSAAEIAGLRAEVDGLKSRLADTQAERDRLAGLLEKAMAPRPGWIQQLAEVFGRRR